MLKDLNATTAMKVSGGLIVTLGLALSVVMWRADTISGQRDAYRDRLSGEEARHSVTRQSVQHLEASLAKQIGAGKAARVAQLAAIEAQAEKSAKLRAEAAEIRAMIEEMEPGDPCDCSTPDFVMEDP